MNQNLGRLYRKQSDNRTRPSRPAVLRKTKEITHPAARTLSENSLNAPPRPVATAPRYFKGLEKN